MGIDGSPDLEHIKDQFGSLGISKEPILELEGEQLRKYLSDMRTSLSVLRSTDLEMKSEIDKIDSLLSFYEPDSKRTTKPLKVAARGSGFPDPITHISIVHDQTYAKQSIDEMIASIIDKGTGLNKNIRPETLAKGRKIGEEYSKASGLKGVPDSSVKAKALIDEVIKERLYSLGKKEFEGLDELIGKELNYAKKVNYLSELASTDIPGSGFEAERTIEHVVRHESENFIFDEYRITLFGYESAQKIFKKYILNVYTKSNGPITDDGPEKSLQKCLNQAFGHDPLTVFSMLDSEKGVEPKSITYIQLGPFHSKDMDNSGLNREIVSRLEDGAYFLTARKEYIERKDLSARDIFRKNFGSGPETEIKEPTVKNYIACEQSLSGLMKDMVKSHQEKTAVYPIKSESK